MNKQRVIYDCDCTLGLRHCEVDDGLVILYLLGREDVDLLGVTTTFGNGPLTEVYPQTAKLLQQWGHGHIPVWRGEAHRGEPPTQAARYLAEMAATYPGQITLLATGPLGNLRAAAELDPCFFANLKQVLIMGGYLHPLRLGYRQVRELNLSGDPEGSFATLNAACPMTLMNAHVCLQAAFTPLDIWRIRRWPADLRRAVAAWWLRCTLGTALFAFYLWDLLPAVHISHPELFPANPVRIRSTVSDLEYGKLVLDTEQGSVVNMPTRITDRRRFRDILYTAWGQALQGMHQG